MLADSKDPHVTACFRWLIKMFMKHRLLQLCCCLLHVSATTACSSSLQAFVAYALLQASHAPACSISRALSASWQQGPCKAVHVSASASKWMYLDKNLRCWCRAAGMPCAWYSSSTAWQHAEHKIGAAFPRCMYNPSTSRATPQDELCTPVQHDSVSAIWHACCFGEEQHCAHQ